MCHVMEQKEVEDEAGEIGREGIWADSRVISQLMMGRARLKLSVCASCLPACRLIQSFFPLAAGAQWCASGTE